MPPRRPVTGRRIAAAIAIIVATTAIALDEGVRAAHLPAYPVVTTTRVTPYVAGTTLTWSAFDQVAANGAAGPAQALRLNGVAGGAMGIVQTGRDDVAGRAASWRSADGGRTWVEHLGPEGVDAFGQVVGRRGVLVTTGRSFLSSTDGETWTPAATGPQAIRTVTLATGPQGFVAFVRNGSSSVTRVWLSATGASNSWVAAPAQSLVASFCPTSVATSSTRVIAIGYDCRVPSRPRVLVSTTGRSWSAGTVPTGLRTSGTYARPPSVSHVSQRFIVTGANSTQTSTWVWTTTDGRSWRRVSGMRRVDDWSVDTIVRIFRLGSGWIAIGHRDMPADDAMLVVWRSADLVHWSRITPAVAGCDATVRMVSQAALVRDTLVAVGTPWSIGQSCGETWMARVPS